MRELLFQARRLPEDELDKGGIVFGLPQYDIDGRITSLCNWYNGKEHILPETICQYIGLKDSARMKIFENDLIKLTQDSDVTYRVVYDSDGAQFVLNRIEENEVKYTKIPISKELLSESVVFGNAIDEV